MLAFSDIFAALRWWLVLFLLGTAVTPLAFTLFKQLPDKGYAFVKMLGLLLVSYVFWLLGSLGFLGNNLGGILVGVLAAVGASAWAFWQDGEAFKTWLRTGWKQIVITEVVFFVAFAVWVWVRAQNPAIAATEKPMEFAFLNSAIHSPTYPPLDPWLSGFGISYYYFGYVMTSVITRLAAVPEAVAFNLGIAWLFAGTAVGAFGLVYNLIAVYKDEVHPHVQRWAVVLGIVAAMAIPLIGNMQIVLEALHGSNIGSAEFWQWLDIRDINNPPDPEGEPRYTGSGWWWWRSSRVINEYTLAGNQVDPEPIAEFPNFSFILGDMHPHVLALPFAFLSLAIAFAWWLKFSTPSDENEPLSPAIWQDSSWADRLKGFVQAIDVPFYLATFLILGGLSFLNTWDVLIHLFIVLGVFFLARWRTVGLTGLTLMQTLLLGFLLAVPAILFYLPFYIGFSSQAGAPFILPMLMRPTRLPQFLVMFGVQLFAIVLMLLVLVVRQRFRYLGKGLITAVSLILILFITALFLGIVIASSVDGAQRVINLANELGISLTPRPEGIALGWGFSAVFAILPDLVRNKIAFAGVTLLLSGILAMVVMVWFELFTGDEEQGRERDEEQGSKGAGETSGKTLSSSPHPLIPSSSLPFVLLLIATGALLTLGPEFVYLKDNFGVRLNTVFKFYYQAWVLLGITAVFSIFYLWHIAAKARQRVVPAIATIGYAIAFVAALMFPFYAVQSRAIEYRGPLDAEVRQPPTLDGLAQFALYNPDEYAAVQWLQEHGTMDDVVLEAVGGAYTNYARVSANTGIPTVLGWPGHEFQWRGTSTDEPGRRESIVADIFNSPNLENSQIEGFLDQYGVTYIFVGNLETRDYNPAGLQKFAQLLDVAYQNGSVTIYRWNPN